MSGIKQIVSYVTELCLLLREPLNESEMYRIVKTYNTADGIKMEITEETPDGRTMHYDIIIKAQPLRDPNR